MDQKIRDYFTGPLELGVSQAMAVEHTRLEAVYAEVQDLRATLQSAIDLLGDVRNQANSCQHVVDDFITEAEHVTIIDRSAAGYGRDAALPKHPKPPGHCWETVIGVEPDA